MEVMIYTSDPDHVDPLRVVAALANANFYVRSVNVNDGERVWNAMEEAGCDDTCPACGRDSDPDAE